MNPARTHIGVDVGREWLDVCYPDGTKEHIKNIRSCRTRLIKKAEKLEAIISFEATGPYEEDLADECLAKGVKAVRLDAWRTRKFAESQGRLEKTDEIDCEMIRDYAASLRDDRIRYVKPRSEAQKRLKKALGVCKNLKKARFLIYNQFEHIHDAGTKRHLDCSLARLEKEIARLEAECDKAIAEDERMRNLAVRFQEVKGVGPCTARAMLAYCPDIGEFSDKSIAKMCGNAPLDHKSCTVIKKSKTKRGRSDLKKALHMAAVCASKNNHILHVTCERLVANGKPKQVALTAIARHIAILLNNIAKYPDFKPARDPKDIERENRPKRPRGRPRKTA